MCSSATCVSHLSVDGELDLVSLTQGVRDVDLQRGVCLQIHVQCPRLQRTTQTTYPIMHHTDQQTFTITVCFDDTCSVVMNVFIPVYVVS